MAVNWQGRAVRRRKRIGLLGVALLVFFMVGCVLLYLYAAVVPQSMLGWVALFGLGIPTWLFLEWLGEVVLESRVFSRLGSFARIALAVPVLIVLAAVAGVLIVLGQMAIGSL
jgi:hypothetical protein